jgi:hypothetical protein
MWSMTMLRFRFPGQRPQVFRLLSACLVLGLMFWLILLAAPSTFAAARAPESPQITHQESLGLSSFDVKVTKYKTVLVRWETGSESQILGFNVWKRVGKHAWQKLNSDMVGAKNTGEVFGNKYSMRDTNVQSGKRYSYQLEVISIYGYSAFTDPIQVKIP